MNATSTQRSIPSAQSPHLVERAQSLIDGVDVVAVDMETKWGVGRLRLLVSPDLRERFDRQTTAWSDAIWTRPIHEVEALSQAMIRGWCALDAEATARGGAALEPVVWEIGLPNGRVAALVRSTAEAHKIAREGRYLEVWTIEEIARVIVAFPEIGAAKEIFPGALVTGARRPSIEPVPIDEELLP